MSEAATTTWVCASSNESVFTGVSEGLATGCHTRSFAGGLEETLAADALFGDGKLLYPVDNLLGGGGATLLELALE